MKWSFRGEDGAVAAIMVVSIVALLGFAAIVVDAGVLYTERRHLQTAADAAALAGVQELPASPAAAVAQAQNYAAINSAMADDLKFTVISKYSANDAIKAEVVDTARGLYFARFLGIDSAPVGAQATAVVASPSRIGLGVMPFGIMAREPSATAMFGYSFNERVVLKQPAGAGESGNFQFVNLTDPPGQHGGGWAVLRDAIREGGVDHPVSIGDQDFTQTGINGQNVVSAMQQLIGGDAHTFADVVALDAAGMAEILDPDCPRIIICPIIVDPGPPVTYNWDDTAGSKLIEIRGFAYFFVEGFTTENMPKGGKRCIITGRFIRPLGPDDEIWEWGPIDPYGRVAFKLID